MTALSEFQRLESQGSWRETPEAPLREVIVSLGDATLVLFDPKTDKPLSHWSLASVSRKAPQGGKTVYSPCSDSADETLAVDDETMIDAIDRVQRAVRLRRTHPGRLRGWMLVLGLVAVLAALAVWLPDAVIRHAARISPPAQARQIGMTILDDIERSTGPVCARKSGQAVLDWVTPRLLGREAMVRVVPGPLNGALRLPGDIYVLGNNLLTGAKGAEAAAGHLIAAKLANDDATVRLGAFQFVGLPPVLRLLTLGNPAHDAVAGYGQTLLSAPLPRPQDDAALLAAFGAAKVSSLPYAQSIDPTGSSVFTLIEQNPLKDAPPGRALLTPQQWQALQQICAG